jgi:hypothetical protein
MRFGHGDDCPENVSSAGAERPEPHPNNPGHHGARALRSTRAGTYFIDPDGDPSTPLRVVYEIPFEGWSQWIGAAKFAEEGTVCSATGCFGHPSHVGVSITTVTNLVTDGCRDHSGADPPVGPSVDDLATALADLAPFQVTSPPKDVTIYGYGGKHLELTVPDLPVQGEGDDLRFTGAPPASSRAGSRSSTPPNQGTRSTATRALATARSTGSSTSKGPV